MTNTDPWVVQPNTNDPLPDGDYKAFFEGVEVYSNDKVKDRFRWKWRIANLDFKGREATALTDRVIKTTTHAGRLIAGMAGRDLVDGENVRQLVDSFIGQWFVITIAPGPKGGKSQVQSVKPIAQQQQQ